LKEIKLAQPQLGRTEKKALLRVLKSGNLAQGPEVAKFEEEFSAFVQERNCVAVNSGTSALHLALLSLGIGKGDEVIVPSFTFAASANAIALTGAKPVFVDINPRTFNIDARLIEAQINPRTKAIMVVHLYGLAAEMTAIQKIAKKHDLFIIEDAAQAHLASLQGRPVGTFGDAAIFSFYPTKNMTSGEGGMIVLKNSEQAKFCRLARNQGMETRYKNEIIGFNLRMTDLHAAIGREQLRKLQRWTLKRIEIAEYYSKNLENILTPHTPSGYVHVFHQYTLRIVTDREKFLTELQENGIGCGVYYPTEVHRLPSFNRRVSLPETTKATLQVLSIPVHPGLKKKQLAKVVSTLNRLSASGI
jgi:perosamine synthetase